MVIRRVDPMSCAKMMGVIQAAVGLLVGIFFSLLGLAVGSGLAGTEELPYGAAVGAMFGVGAIVFLPIFYGVIGLLSGAIGALIYNLAAGVVGGVEVELDGAVKS